MNPNFYFSEGQLSALSVSALLAASTTFGWSRWRGLLLDDPLQHNDVIHASAFMDLLRQMVRELGYQIMSTHDSAEAEFLGRKCRSAPSLIMSTSLFRAGRTALSPRPRRALAHKRPADR
jgi:exonuclease SbcC